MVSLFPVGDVNKRLEEAHKDLQSVRLLLQQQLAVLEKILVALEK